MKKIVFALASLLAVGAGYELDADELVWGVTENQFLVSWDSSTPGNLQSGFAITGLQTNEQILGIDFRPENNQLYGIGSSNRLYQISNQGVATQVGPAFNTVLDGSAFGYDFNPTIDRSRIDTDTNNNYVVNPNNGAIVQVTDLFYDAGDANFGVDPNVTHIGYTNSFAGADVTQLYAIDTGLDLLATQANSAGTLQTVGDLGIDITAMGGFDISGLSGIAYGAFQTSDSSFSNFYTIDLTTGQATLVGEIDGGIRITALAVQTVPEPSAAVTLLTVLGIAVSRRKRA